jgi:hypothetical protein
LFYQSSVDVLTIEAFVLSVNYRGIDLFLDGSAFHSIVNHTSISLGEMVVVWDQEVSVSLFFSSYNMGVYILLQRVCPDMVALSG